MTQIPSHIRTAAATALALVGFISVAAAQTQPPPTLKPTVPVKVELVLSRFQAEKKISSLPFTLWVNAPGDPRMSGTQSLRMGMDVPVGTVWRTTGAQGRPTSSTRT